MNTNKKVLAIALILALTGCGGGGTEVPKDVNVTVSSPNDPAKSSSDLTGGKHIPTVPVAETSHPTTVTAPPQMVTVPSSSLNVTTGPDTMTIPADIANQTAKNSVDEPTTQSNSANQTDTSSVDTSFSTSQGSAPSKLYCTPEANGGVQNSECPEPYVPNVYNGHP